jgi:hypothetical protein
MKQPERDDAGTGAQGREGAARRSPSPPNPAGPHARPELTDNNKTPGSGVLPEPGDAEGSTSG